MIEPGTVLQNRYSIENQIGAGGMGAVYLAVDGKFNSRVAIKETFYKDEHLREAFEREAQLLNSLHHPVLPHVSDYFIEAGKNFLVMEFIEGEDLSEILKHKGAFAPADFLRWANQLLDALDFLHSQEPPIIHRDIKPQNLKITTRGDIVLLDFGLAKLESADSNGTKSVFGYSRTYSPLEQIEGTGTDARSDIFALAASGFHLLTGRPPADALKRAAAVVNGNPDPLVLASEINRHIPIAVAEVLHKALALNPVLRFESASEMQSALALAIDADSADAESNETALPAALDEANGTARANVETDFPALAAFAAETGEGGEPQIQIAILPSTSVSVPSVQSTTPVVVREAATRVRPAKNNRRLTVATAALLAVFALGGAAVWFSNSRAEDSATESNQTANRDSIFQTAPTPAVSASPSPNTEPKIAEAAEKTAPPREAVRPSSAAAIENRANPPASTEKQTPERVAATAPNKTAPPRLPATAPRTETSAPPTSRIEEILTGGDRRARRDERRRRREERRNRRLEPLSEREKDELRRRRTEDVLRQNRRP